MVMTLLDLFHCPLPQSVTTSIGSAAALSGRTGLSVCVLRRQQARDDLLHILYVSSLTNSPLLVEAIIVHLLCITRLRTAKRADLEALLLTDILAPSPDVVEDLISIAGYANRYVVAQGNHITKKVVRYEK